MHLSRFITMAICAMTRISGSPPESSWRGVRGSAACVDVGRSRGRDWPRRSEERAEPVVGKADIHTSRPRSTRTSVLHLLRAATDDGDLVALVARRTDVVERVRVLCVPADQV